ncbi:MAG: hypothetical protein GTO49_20050 [Anaerolineae bacterium]|nr:hypothetical protein [Anaerolineae bacterium]
MERSPSTYVLTLPSGIPWHSLKAPALLFEVGCFRCQPQPGADHVGAGAVYVADRQPG